MPASRTAKDIPGGSLRTGCPCRHGAGLTPVTSRGTRRNPPANTPPRAPTSSHTSRVFTPKKPTFAFGLEHLQLPFQAPGRSTLVISAQRTSEELLRGNPEDVLNGRSCSLQYCGEQGDSRRDSLGAGLSGVVLTPSVSHELPSQTPDSKERRWTDPEVWAHNFKKKTVP